MDKIRIGLIATLVLITFVMLVEFGKFREARSRENANLRQALHEQQLPPPGEEIPAAAVVADQASLPDPDALSLSNDLIVVETDTLLVQIDPQGGDIVSVALKKHLARLDTPGSPFVLLENSADRVYVAQSGLIGQNGTDTATGRPHFSSKERRYQLAEGANEVVVDLFYQDGQAAITKRFTFPRNDYLIGVDYLVRNNGSDEWRAAFYAQIKRDGSQDPSAESGNVGVSPYLGFATITKEERFHKIDFEAVQEGSFSNLHTGGWIAMVQHYFLSAWIPDSGQQHEFSTFRSRSGFYFARLKSPVVSVAPGQEAKISNSFYAGPKDQYRLETIAQGLDLSVDYGMLWMVAQPLYALLYFFNKGVIFGQNLFGGFHNWGFSIIALTILVKLAFFWLNQKAYHSMAKMRTIQPKMLELKNLYPDDRQKQSREMMALYQKEGVNPLGGCLPILVQMPVFIALYWVLLESVELRHAPFIGYIKDLSAMDPYFILPLVMGASMWFQQKLNPPPPDPMQAKVMEFLPIIFTFFFLFFPSGLVLYWVVNNILSIAQQWVITRQVEKASKP